MVLPFVPPGAYVTDKERFTPPRFGGGDIGVKFGVFTFNDSTPRTLFTLPQGAVIVDIIIEVTEAFNAATTNTADIGPLDDPDGYADGVAMGTAAILRYGGTNMIKGVAFGTPLAGETPVLVEYKSTGAAATAGRAIAGVFYIRL